MSRYDRELWDSVWLCAKDIDGTSSDSKLTDHYKDRMRGHLHIPDLLLILASKQEYIEGRKTTFLEALNYVADMSGYVNNRWEQKFDHEVVHTKFSRMKVKVNDDNSESENNYDDEEGEIDWGGDGTKDGENYWIIALTKWVEFLSRDNQE